MMKALGVFLVSSITAASAAEVEWPRLAGIVQVTRPRAVLIMPASASPRTLRGDFPIVAHLRAGETHSGYEVLSIDPLSGTVRLAYITSTEKKDLKLGRLEVGQNYAVHFEAVPLNAAIDAYQALSGRTVIHSPQLPPAQVDAHVPALPRAEVLAGLAQALEVHDILLIPYGDQYAFALPARHKDLAESIPPPPQTGDSLIPAGMIKFVKADLLHALDFYSDLSGRTVLRPSHLTDFRVTVDSQTPLSREDAVWVLEAAFRLGGLMTIRSGDKFVFMVPPNRVNGLPVFDPARKLPGSAGLMKLEAIDRELFLETYAALTGRKPLPVDATVPHAKFSMRTPKSLEPTEAAFALEALAFLNNLAFQPIGENEVKLIPRSSLKP